MLGGGFTPLTPPHAYFYHTQLLCLFLFSYYVYRSFARRKFDTSRQFSDIPPCLPDGKQDLSCRLRCTFPSLLARRAACVQIPLSKKSSASDDALLFFRREGDLLRLLLLMHIFIIRSCYAYFSFLITFIGRSLSCRGG